MELKGKIQNIVRKIIKTESKNICIQGLGYVGAATISVVARAKNINGDPLYNIIGLDLNNKEGRQRIKSINNGRFPFHTKDKDLVKSIKDAHKEKRLVATYDVNYIKKADIIVVNVPLDVDWKNKLPYVKFDNFDKAILDIGSNMKADALIIVETTVPPGTCEKKILPILKKCFNKRKISSQNINLSHSYERVMPGPNYLDSIINNWRVYSGHSSKSAKLCESFLSTIINTNKYPLTKLSSLTSSEIAKIMENSYRAVNIAFIEEWARFSEKIGANSFEIINAIRRRPTHSNIRQPGFGVGGYCLTKDPLFAKLAANDLFKIKNLNFPFCEMGVKVNNNMPMENFNLIKKYLKKMSNIRILLLGASYRSEVDDTRYSPSEVFIKRCMKNKINVDVHDPYAKNFDSLDIKILKKMPSIKRYHAVILAVNHKFYCNFNFVKWMGNSKKIFMDTTNSFPDKIYNKLKNNGIRVIITGRGDL